MRSYFHLKGMISLTKARYEKIRLWFLARPTALKGLMLLNLWLPRLVYCTYPVLLAVLIFRGDTKFFKVLLVPALTFAMVTVLRLIWNLPRPYEKLGIEPLIPREKSGKSFPSRHAASAAIIAAACWYVWPPLGIAMSFIALLIAVVRPLAGIHFPLDTLVGVLIGLFFGLVGLWIM